MVPAQHEIQRRDSTIPLAVWTRSNASEHKDSVNFNGLDMSNETIEFSTFSSPDDSPRTVRWDHDAATTCSGKRRTISARSHARVSAGAWPTASASCLSVTSRSVCSASRVKIESAGSSAAHFRSTAARRRSVQSCGDVGESLPPHRHDVAGGAVGPCRLSGCVGAVYRCRGRIYQSTQSDLHLPCGGGSTCFQW